MEDSKIVMVKLYNGEFVIGTVDPVQLDDLSSCIAIDDPRSFMMVPTATGTIGVALRPVCAPFKCPRLEKSLEVNRDQIMFMLDESELDTDVVNGYKSEISGIKIASSSETASILSPSSARQPKDIII